MTNTQKLQAALMRACKGTWRILAWAGAELYKLIKFPSIVGLSFYRKSSIIFLGCLYAITVIIGYPELIITRLLMSSMESIARKGRVETCLSSPELAPA